MSGQPGQPGSVPATGLASEFAHYLTRATWPFNPTPQGKEMYTRINGDLYSRGSNPLYGVSGLAPARGVR